MDSSHRVLKKGRKSYSQILNHFPNFGRKPKILAENRKKFKSIARREYLIKLQCVIYQWI